VTVEDVAGGKRVQFKLHDKRAAAPPRHIAAAIEKAQTKGPSAAN
jgi:small ligand-binding sensory domain FIST